MGVTRLYKSDLIFLKRNLYLKNKHKNKLKNWEEIVETLYVTFLKK